MAIWAYATSSTDQTALCISDGSATAHRRELGLDAGENVDFLRDAGGTQNTIQTTSTVGLNAWHHLCCWASAADSVAVYQDGANKITGSTSRAPDAGTVINIGSKGSGIDEFTGRLAHAAIWSRVLSDNEILGLGASGLSPLLFPEGLIMYCPMFDRYDPIQDWMGTTPAFTKNGTPTYVTGSHPPIIMPSKQRSG